MTPGLVVAVMCLIAAIAVVGEVASHSGNAKPPNPDQVISLSPAPPPTR
jgi:hypothetical protein